MLNHAGRVADWHRIDGDKESLTPVARIGVAPGVPFICWCRLAKSGMGQLARRGIGETGIRRPDEEGFSPVAGAFGVAVPSLVWAVAVDFELNIRYCAASVIEFFHRFWCSWCPNSASYRVRDFRKLSPPGVVA